MNSVSRMFGFAWTVGQKTSHLRAVLETVCVSLPIRVPLLLSCSMDTGSASLCFPSGFSWDWTSRGRRDVRREEEGERKVNLPYLPRSLLAGLHEVAVLPRTTVMHASCQETLHWCQPVTVPALHVLRPCWFLWILLIALKIALLYWSHPTRSERILSFLRGLWLVFSK